MEFPACTVELYLFCNSFGRNRCGLYAYGNGNYLRPAEIFGNMGKPDGYCRRAHAARDCILRTDSACDYEARKVRICLVALAEMYRIEVYTMKI